MSRKKKISLVMSLLLLTVAFGGLGVIVTNTTLESTQAVQENVDSDQKEAKAFGKKGNQKAAEDLIDQTVSREEIEEQVGEWNNFELDGAGCERGVYAGKFFYDNIIINSRTYDKGETFRVVEVREQ